MSSTRKTLVNGSEKIKNTFDLRKMERNDVFLFFGDGKEIDHQIGKTNYYSRFQFSTEIPNIIDVQRQSFYSFVEHGLKQAFQQPLTFSTATHDIEIIFFPEGIQFRKPEFTQKQAFLLGKTYGSSVYIPVGIQSKVSSTFRIEWLFVGVLPLMTQQGHFIVNGISRVVLHQMIRNPGIYTIPRDSRTQTATVRIVPERGSWINITIDKKNRIWFSTGTLRRKVSLLVFLQALGLSLDDIFARLENSRILKNSFVNEFVNGKSRHDKVLVNAGLYKHPETQEQAWQYLYSHFVEYSPYARKEYFLDPQKARDFFWNALWNKDKLVLGKIGRHQFREKVGSMEPLENLSLTIQDILGATQALLDLMYKKRLGDEIDSLTQKRIRGCDEFLLEQLLTGIKEFQGFLKKKITLLPGTKSARSTQDPLDTLWRQNKAVFSKVISKSWKRFFTSGTLAQFMDQTNPLAEITHKRRLTVLGPGGISNKQTTIKIRGIHPTYYGRFCPIETPEGKNAGLVNSFTVLATLSKHISGNLNTPFYQVYKGQVQKTLPPLCISPRQESQLIGAPADIPLTSWNILPKTSLPVRKELNFDSENSTRITAQSVGILQNISVATSLIPFLEHDDANRALMGSNMQRQAVPLLTPQAPLVGTGLETRVICDVQHGIQASQSGYITGVSSRKVTLLTPKKLMNPFSRLSSLFGTPRKSFGFFSAHNSPSRKKSTFDLDSENQKITFFLRQTSIKKRVLFANRKKEKKQNVLRLMEGCPTVIQSNLRKQDLKNQKTYSLARYKRTNQSTCISERPILSETTWVEKGDLLTDGAASSRGKLSIGQNVLVAYLPWEGYNFEDAVLISQRLVDQDIFTSLHIDHYDIEVKNTQHGLERITNKIPLKIYESTRDVFKIEKLNSRGLVEIGSWVEEGDYLVGKISPLNPKGPSIQNQYEKLYNVIMQREKTNSRNTSLRVPKGVQGFVLGVQILPSQEPDVTALAEKNEILRVRVILLQRRKIQVGDKMAGRHGNKGIVSKILSRYDMPYLPDGTPIDIVLNPLGVPSRMNVGQILECLLGLAGLYLQESYTTNLFDEQFGAEASRSAVYSKLYQASIKSCNPWLFEPHHPGKIKLFDGRTGIPFDQPITVGCAYILKLVHLVDDKIHARATGPYSAVTQQPVRGRSRNGGQRLGEMEVWALQAYGAAYTLHELLTLKSDDIEGKKQTVVRIYANKPLTSGSPESFKVILRELQALCFDLQLYGIQKIRLIGKKNSIFWTGPIPLTKLENLL